jgi:short-subunit dehydrogenase
MKTIPWLAGKVAVVTGASRGVGAGTEGYSAPVLQEELVLRPRELFCLTTSKLQILDKS